MLTQRVMTPCFQALTTFLKDLVVEYLIFKMTSCCDQLLRGHQNVSTIASGLVVLTWRVLFWISSCHVWNLLAAAVSGLDRSITQGYEFFTPVLL